MAAKNQHNSTVTLVAGGDIGPVMEPVDQYADLLPPVWRQADLRFAQCERTYSERGTEPQYILGPPGGHSRLHPRLASIWKAAGIDIISLASNHTMDWGPEALLDTCELFRGMGKHIIGAGKDDDEARQPAIVEYNGVRIAFLGYCSVIRDGQAAGPRKVGIAPMRVHTHHLVEDFQPGSPAVAISVPHEADLVALQEDIRAAKKRADVVVMSIHWGIRFVPKTLATYQTPVAHAAIDAGADLILGHHSHVPKAVEVYKGKVCFYSIGNFATNGFGSKPIEPNDMMCQWNLFWFRVDPEYKREGFYCVPNQSHRTTIAKAVFSKKGVERVSFLPAHINSKAQLSAIPSSDAKFQEMLEYMEWVSDQHSHKFRVDGDEIVIGTSS